MTRDQLNAIGYRQFTIDEIEYGGALTPPHRARAQAQLASALSIEWWRGYFAGVDLALSLGEPANRGEDEARPSEDREYLDELEKAAILKERHRCLVLLQNNIPESEAAYKAVGEIAAGVKADGPLRYVRPKP